jgi:hypothetical protein
MTMEYAGAVHVVPPFRADESEWLEDTDWIASADGRTIRPHQHAELDDCVQELRDLVGVDLGARTYDGAVAAYDPYSWELVLISTRDGRVTRRTLRKARPVASHGNVIVLATHRRTISRQIG